VNTVAVTPDSQYVISGSWDASLKIWDLVKGEPLTSFYAEAGIDICKVSADGETLIVGDRLRQAHLLHFENLALRPLTVTARRTPADSKWQIWDRNPPAVWCPHCHNWSQIENSDLGGTLACPQCSNKLFVNQFAIDADWGPAS
jgi:WD40 repeat protein